jgi:glucokinase
MADRLIGVDVGGTKVSVAVLEGNKLSEPTLRPTVLKNSDALIKQLEGLILDQGPAAAVGIGIPSVVDFATGTARSSVNVPLQDIPLRRRLTQHLKLPVFVDNDATCAALAEAYDDNLKPVANSLFLFTVGTGVGGGIVIGGRIYRGATGAAPEVGHTMIGLDLKNGAPKASKHFPQEGSLESLAAGRQLDELGEKLGIGRGPEVVTAAENGDKQAIDAIRIIGERLGIGIANAINTFDPDAVVIGGGVSRAGKFLLEPAKRVALEHVLPGVGTKTTIRLANYGPTAGVRGAALLAGQEVSRS